MTEPTTVSPPPPPTRVLVADALDGAGVICACALRAAYRDEHGEEFVLRVGSADAVDAAKAFDDAADVAQSDGASEPSAGGPHPDDCINLAPAAAPGAPALARNLADRLRTLLRLPEDSLLAFPTPVPEAQSAGRALAAAAGMIPGRSLLLLAPPPHQRQLVHPHFSALATAASTQGLAVFAVDDDAGWGPKGAAGIKAPRPLLASLAEEAGWTVAIASADSLLIGAARGRKTFVHLRRGDIRLTGARALGLSADAYEIGFAFEGETPDQFAARVLALEEDRPLPSPARLSDAVSADDLETRDCVTLLRGAAATQKRGLLSKRPLSCRLINVPPRSHPRLGEETEAILATFISEARKDDRYLVCRDVPDGFDYFEEVDAVSLAAGVYACAGGTHCVLRVGKEGLKPLLAAPGRRKVLERSVFELGHYQHIGRSVATPAHVAFLHGDRPIDLGGFQLLRGWNDLEHWGVWSSGESSIAKFSVGSPPTAPVTLELESKILVTQATDVLELDVEVNRHMVARFRFEASQNALLRITMDPEVLSSATAYIVFHHRHPRSPAALGLGPDHRRMALGLVTANLRHGA